MHHPRASTDADAIMAAVDSLDLDDEEDDSTSGTEVGSSLFSSDYDSHDHDSVDSAHDGDSHDYASNDDHEISDDDALVEDSDEDASDQDSDADADADTQASDHEWLEYAGDDSAIAKDSGDNALGQDSDNDTNDLDSNGDADDHSSDEAAYEDASDNDRHPHNSEADVHERSHDHIEMMLDNKAMSPSHNADTDDDWHTATKKALSNVEDLSGLDASVMGQTWPEATLTVLDRISNRGREALLPATWKWDFRYLPDILFTDVAKDHTAFVRAVSVSKNNYAVKALSDLFQMAARARDADLVGLRPEVYIARHIMRYQSWAIVDSGLVKAPRHARRVPSMLAVVTGTKHESPQDLTERLRAKFAKLERRWLEIPASGGGFHNRPLPTFYGFMISHSVVALWSYEPVDRSIGMLQPRATAAGTGLLRSIALFQTSQRGYDVWNALIVAIVVVQTRDEMIRLSREGVMIAPPERPESPGPDA